MPLIEISSIEDPQISIFTSLTERQLRNETESGMFIAESPKVIRVALEEGYEPMALLCERKHIRGDAADIVKSLPDLNVYTGPREVLARLTGYTLTRGVLCAMKRKDPCDPREICKNKKRVAVIEDVCDTTNIGSIFRSAAALGINAILLTPRSCDPLNRRSIRVSMGAVFKVPWAFAPNPVDLLKQKGFTTIALALEKNALPIDSPLLKTKNNIAMVLGTEGDGLSPLTISKCDFKAIIPMWHNIDSLNVGAAAAIAFWELSKQV